MQPSSEKNTQENPLAALERMIPAVRHMQIGGQQIEIRPFKIGALPAVLRTVAPIMHLLTQSDKLDMATLFLMHADDCLELMAVLANQPRAWVNELESDQALALFTALLEVNIDFFIQNILPKVSSSVRSLTEKIQNGTPMPATQSPMPGPIASKA